jgi:CRP/FNR family transcriptional activator FtrB
VKAAVPFGRLRSLQPFANLSDGTRKRLLARAQVESLPRGEVLFREGARAEFVHFILEGSIGLSASAEKPEATIVEIFRAGELFVLPAAILRLPYLVSAVALAPAKVLAIPAAAFRELLERDLALARGVTEVLARHWRVLVEQVKDLKLRSAPERLAVYVLALCGAARPGRALEIELAEPRKALAARLNMTPENLSRAFVVLRAHGVSTAGKTGLRIEDTARLRAFAYTDARD